MNLILEKITNENHLSLISTKALAGGDINEAFLLKCKEGDFVVKINDAYKFPGMFEAEAKGLQLLRTSESFKIPEVINYGMIASDSYLLLEFISEGNPTSNFWELFAEQLSTLHKITQPYFGLEHDNYIGSLPQYNKNYDSVSEFYITQRMEPQFRMAADNGFSFKKLDLFYKTISDEIPDEPSALIHGDLWAGNFMVSEKGKPVLIDPAVAFAPREMDLGMMQLFGGFPDSVFEVYNSYFPLQPDWNKRVDIWQLYYLLVHLNLFGSGYLSRVKAIVSKYL